MIEYFEILGMIIIGIIIFRRLFSTSKRIIKEPNLILVNIEERIGCVGQYNGRDIPAYIKLDDGRLFEYASLAIQDGKGNYFAESDLPHIKIDENLLYKLVIE